MGLKLFQKHLNSNPTLRFQTRGGFFSLRLWRLLCSRCGACLVVSEQPGTCKGFCAEIKTHHGEQKHAEDEEKNKRRQLETRNEALVHLGFVFVASVDDVTEV